MSHLGVTGTRKGMTPAQRAVVEEVLPRYTRLNHGDCIGVDEQTDEMARALGLDVTVFPPTDDKYAAGLGDAFTRRKPAPYLTRNLAIVLASDALIAVPEGPERLRSGTWSCVRHARRAGLPILIVYPDGTAQTENWTIDVDLA